MKETSSLIFIKNIQRSIQAGAETTTFSAPAFFYYQ